MNEPERQLDPPWPGDLSEAEYQERRSKALRNFTDAEIADMVSDTRALSAMVWMHWFNLEANGKTLGDFDHQLIGERFVEYMRPSVEAAIEQKLMEGK